MRDPISSPQNSVFKDLLECLNGKGIKKHGLFIISGAKVVRETLQDHPHLVRNLIGTAGVQESTLAEFARAKTGADEKPVSVLEFSKELFDQIDIFGTHSPLLVLQTPTLKDAQLNEAPAGLEILCGLSDPSNLGALMRSAAAFGATRLILFKESASPFHPKAVRAASGAVLSLDIQRGPSIREFKSSGVVALDMSGQNVTQFAWPPGVRVLIGEEGQGVPRRENYQLIAIPMNPDVESLNATVAASIAMYSYRAQHSL